MKKLRSLGIFLILLSASMHAMDETQLSTNPNYFKSSQGDFVHISDLVAEVIMQQLAIY